MPTTIHQDFAEMSHGKTRYYEIGEGPPLLLVHGANFTNGAHNWIPVLPALSEHFHCYAIDCLGWGPGDVLEQEYSFAYLTDHLREFQDVMGFSRSHVIGHSMGGWLGVLLAYESPERVEKYVNVSGGGVATRALQGMVEWKPPTEEAIREAIEPLTGTNIEPEELVQEWIALTKDEKHKASFRGIMDHMTNPETRTRYNTQRRLRQLKVPMLVAWGSADKTNDIELGHLTHELTPGSEIAVFDGVGHFVYKEAPDQFAKTIIDYLKS